MSAERVPVSAERPFSFSKTYRWSEFSQHEREQVEDAEQKGMISTFRAGDVLDVRFNPLTDAQLEFLPKELVHLTRKNLVPSILAQGLKPENGKVYLQSPELHVEPEGTSLISEGKSHGLVRTSTAEILEAGSAITLDPESLHGIPGEYLHAFIVHGPIPASFLWEG